MKLFLTRLVENEKETLGVLRVYKGLKKVFECKTLELPYRNNKRNLSCIPAGTYRLTRRFSTRYGNHLAVQDVEGRSYILIHVGNFYKDTKGCILVGKKYEDLDGDGVLDVSNSRQTLTDLMYKLRYENDLELTIV